MELINSESLTEKVLICRADKTWRYDQFSLKTLQDALNTNESDRVKAYFLAQGGFISG